MRTDGIECPICKNITIPWEELSIYGYNAKDLLKLIQLVQASNVRKEDLNDCIIVPYHWRSEKIKDAMLIE